MRIPRQSLLVACFTLAFLVVPKPAAADDGEQTTYRFGVGMQKVLTIPGMQRFSVGDETIVHVRRIDSSTLLLTAVGGGKTTVLVWKRGGRRVTYLVQVVSHEHEDRYMAIRRQFPDSPDVEIRSLGEQVTIGGRLDSLEDLRRAKDLPGAVVEASLSPVLLRDVVARLNEAFASAEISGVRAEVREGRIVLAGDGGPEAWARAERLAQERFPDLSIARGG